MTRRLPRKLTPRDFLLGRLKCSGWTQPRSGEMEFDAAPSRATNCPFLTTRHLRRHHRSTQRYSKHSITPARAGSHSIESHQGIRLADKTSAQLNELYLAKLVEGELLPTASLFNTFCTDTRRFSELREVQTTGTFSLEVIDVECGMEQSAVAITIKVTPDGPTEPFCFEFL